uniref:Ig-like domain-containing protein n=1 Tax=Canis lupus familiaris TaxID=9615 RepID=A0A8C0Q8K5_CANLF
PPLPPPLVRTTLGCFLGCSSLRGPDSVSGTVGGSLSVRCQYKEVFRDHDKYWCKSPCVWKKIVETTESQREVTKGRVSIRDHPADLTFTVTLKSLTEGDAGTYKCGIDTLWWVDPTFSVVVSVNPGELCTLTCPLVPVPGLPEGSQRGMKLECRGDQGDGIRTVEREQCSAHVPSGNAHLAQEGPGETLPPGSSILPLP